MEIKKRRFSYQVESSRKGEYYTIDLTKNTCTCPDYKIRRARAGTDCKHIAAVKEKYSAELSDEEVDGKNLLSYVKDNGPVDSIELLRKYGERAVNQAIRKGDILENRGKVELLE